MCRSGTASAAATCPIRCSLSAEICVTASALNTSSPASCRQWKRSTCAVVVRAAWSRRGAHAWAPRWPTGTVTWADTARYPERANGAVTRRVPFASKAGLLRAYSRAGACYRRTFDRLWQTSPADARSTGLLENLDHYCECAAHASLQRMHQMAGGGACSRPSTWSGSACHYASGAGGTHCPDAG